MLIKKNPNYYVGKLATGLYECKLGLKTVYKVSIQYEGRKWMALYDNLEEAKLEIDKKLIKIGKRPRFHKFKRIIKIKN